MQSRLSSKILKNFFWISLLLHLLFFLLFFIAIKPSEDKHKQPQEYVPSYLYNGSIKPTAQYQQQDQTQNSNKTQTQNTMKPTMSKMEEKDQAIEKEAKQAISRAKSSLPEPSMLASSLTALHNNQMEDITKPREVAEPILLVGDDHEIADPFIRLIGRALSAYFKYPEMEGRLGIHGRVLIEMTLHPEGYFDEVEIVQSSSNDHLDAAALYAVNKAPRIESADMFIKKPKRFVVGFVFVIN